MKKIFGGVLALLLVMGGIFYFTTFFAYQPSEDLFNFPIPKNAELVHESKNGKTYTWSKASEEKGIPLGYEIVLKANEWEKEEREGASVYYTKGNHQIDVISQTKQLTLSIMK